MILKTLDELFNEILTNKVNYPSVIGLTNESNINDNQTLLSELNSETDVARWIHISRLVAESEYNLQSWIQSAQTEFNSILESRGNAWNLEAVAYWAKKFQSGDIVVCDESTNFIPTYNPTNTSHQIIKSCTAEFYGKKVRLKIAGKTNNILSDTELTEFTQYMSKIKPNNKFIFVNKESDKLKLIATIIYDGQTNLQTLKGNVETSINNYIQNISFDSNLYTNFLIDSIQSVTGVFNIELQTLESREDDQQTFMPIVNSVKSSAGYFNIDGNYPLSTYLTYKIK